MVYKGTKLNVSDNSGAKKVECIHVCKSKQRVAGIGDAIIVSVKNLRSSKRSTARVKKGEMHTAIIVRCKTLKTKNRVISNSVSFIENSVVLISKQRKLLGTRIIGPIPKSFKFTKYSRFAALAFGLV